MAIQNVEYFIGLRGDLEWRRRKVDTNDMLINSYSTNYIHLIEFIRLTRGFEHTWTVHKNIPNEIDMDKNANAYLHPDDAREFFEWLCNKEGFSLPNLSG